jgi:hypothetical protein
VISEANVKRDNDLDLKSIFHYTGGGWQGGDLNVAFFRQKLEKEWPIGPIRAASRCLTISHALTQAPQAKHYLNPCPARRVISRAAAENRARGVFIFRAFIRRGRNSAQGDFQG